MTTKKQSKWNGNMPQEVSEYAKYKNLVSGESLPDIEPLAQFLDKVDYINRFENIPPDRDKWDYLNRYYIEPLRQVLEDLEDFGFEETHETTYSKENPVEHALMVKASEADDNRLVG